MSLDLAALRRQFRRLPSWHLGDMADAMPWYLNSVGMPVVARRHASVDAAIEVALAAGDLLVSLTARPHEQPVACGDGARDARYVAALALSGERRVLQVTSCVVERLSRDVVVSAAIDYHGIGLANIFSEEIETRMVEHMNDDHVEALLAYCRHAGIATVTRAPQMIGIDGDGFDLLVDDGLARLDFDQPCVTPMDARKALVALAERARNGTVSGS